MKELSLQPDKDMAWIYDPSHRDYNTPRAVDLRELRARAIAKAPEHMVREAELNDSRRNK